MQYHNALDLVAQEFGKAQVPCLLIGGFAVNYYKASRNTNDIDFLICVDNVEKAAEILRSYGYQPVKSGKPFRQFRHPDLRFMAVDLVLVDSETFDGIIEESIEATIAGEQFRIPSLDHLIALKLHAIKSNSLLRELKDLPDIISLIKIHKVDTKSEKFR